MTESVQGRGWRGTTKGANGNMERQWPCCEYECYFPVCSSFFFFIPLLCFNILQHYVWHVENLFAVLLLMIYLPRGYGCGMPVAMIAQSLVAVVLLLLLLQDAKPTPIARQIAQHLSRCRMLPMGVVRSRS